MLRWTAKTLYSLVLIIALVVLTMPPAFAQHEDTAFVQRVQTPHYTLDAHGVSVPGYALDLLPGAPQLPVKGLLVELPLDGAWQVSYRLEGSRVLPQAVGVPPAPSPVLNLNRPTGWADDLDALPSAVPTVNWTDPAIYQTNAFYPAAPVEVGEAQRQGDKRLLPIRVFPFQYNPVTRQLRYHPDVVVTVQVQQAEATPASAVYQPEGFYQATSLPGEGVLRVHTQEQGLYRLTYNELDAAGVTVGSGGEDPATFAIYYKGQPVDIEVTGAGDGSFDDGDLVIFYAEPYDGGRYQNYNVYQFVYGDGVVGQRMALRPVSADIPPAAASIITQTLHVERNLDYRSLYPRPSDADHFFDTQLYVTTAAPTATKGYDLALDDPITSTGIVQVAALLHGGIDNAAAPDQSVALRLNSHDMGVYQWDGMVEHLITATVPITWFDAAPNQLHLTAALAQLPGLPPPPGGTSPYYWVSPDWVKISYRALANAEGDRILIAEMPGPVGQVAVSGFTTSTVTALDVSDPAHPLRLEGVGAQGGGGAYLLHWDETMAGRAYVLSSEAALLAPSAVERDTPSNWADPDNAYDYVAIIGAQRLYTSTTGLGAQLAAAVQPLLAYRAAEGFSVATVDVLDIYDEWSYGRIDPMAIRSFLSYAYHNWQTRPRYVLLVGDGHYDYNRVTTQKLPNLVPPYLIDIDPFMGETAADNRYVSVDSPADYVPNMAIGRLPVVSAADVTAMVNKTLDYESEQDNPQGDWQQRAVYVADNYSDPAGNFHQLSEDVRSAYLPGAYQFQRIYYRMDASHDTGAEMRTAIRTALDQGALYAQWFGHGNALRWGSVSMWNVYDTESLQPNTRMAFTMHNACWTGYFIVNSSFGDRQAMAETMVLEANRGSVADFSPTGLHIGSALSTLNQGMHVGLFQQRIPRAGDVADFSRLYFYQNSFTWHDLIDTMVFFGDPALKLRYPTGDLASSSLAVSDAVAPLGASLHYTLTISNTSIFTTSQPLVTVDYPQSLAAVVEANGALDDGDTLAWSLPDLPAASQQVVTFTLRAENMPLPESYDLAVPATVSSQMAPSVALEAHTQILTAPAAVASTLATQRDWLPPGFPVTATLAISHSGDLPAPGVLVTMTLPAELGAPTWLSATTSSLVYDAVAHRITWSGGAPAGGPTRLGFSSVISPSLAACADLALDAVVAYRNATTPQTVLVNLVVPDVDCSGAVTVADIQQMAARWGALAGDALYHPRYDLNADDVIDVLDITAAAQAWN